MPNLMDFLPTPMEAIFIPIALFTGGCALFTVLARNLFHSALGLVGTLFGIAGLFIMLEAEFVAISQVLVYVGAISTLIIFAVMLTRGMMFGRTAISNRILLAGAIVTAFLFFEMLGVVMNVPWPNAALPLNQVEWAMVQPLGSVGENIIANLGFAFVNQYLVPFELTALLLLVALAGALILARDDR